MLLILLHENKKRANIKKIPNSIQDKRSVLHSAKKLHAFQDLSNCFELGFAAVITGFLLVILVGTCHTFIK